ncbi:site-specific DNA-methyltransferase [Natronorubrum sp. JWXQ-INN-674]|uniref:Type II methyltransferase n=1 Tax=Natronorubrum halalkaliphilum TaxID=2691917 RepID=A0A6B0VHK6_9EURY|nr:DNA methyltransferase [Natronorubrum halalkaliphilum]MXV61331.1 site-specific DNA-methyltransferase [Natronorubrum halalkaliphilum]
MDTYRSVEYAHSSELPVGHTTEVRTPNALVEQFLSAYSDAGDTVIDIFAGYGTTLTVAERIGRTPYGLEYEAERVSHIRDRIATPDHVRRGDVLELDSSWFPACDCCFTSPPFMERTDDRNPFRNYSGSSSYEEYLADIETAFGNLAAVLTPGATVVVDIANIKHEGRVTPLAWDVAARVSNVFHFEGEVVITWEGGCSPDERDGRFGYGYDHSYCLVFRKGDE